MASYRNVIIMTALLSVGLLTSFTSAHAQVITASKNINVQSRSASPSTITDFFKPRPNAKTRLDYDAWDSILENMVFYTNISTRTRAPIPRPRIGSNLVIGHTSPYRLEGNKIPFSDLSDTYLKFITEYREDLEDISHRIDLPSLPRNEQLAFWLNLHNVVIIEQIALNYPVKNPSRIRIGINKTPLHNAKIVSISGKMLSLRDIRENIVYQHWQNPLVVYGFFLGDIGSPTIQNSAFTAENLKELLTRGAEEFTNSLRGFSRGWVSQIYFDIQPYFFENFETDLREHLKKYMFEEVRTELDKAQSFKKSPYATTVADLSGGDPSHNTNFYDDRGRSSKTILISKLIEKRRMLKLKGIVKSGTVIIEEIETNHETNPTSQTIN